jgi:hypothetical protein
LARSIPEKDVSQSHRINGSGARIVSIEMQEARS